MRPHNADRKTRVGVIVVGLDGSLHSVDVLREGARIAQAMGCSRESVIVWQPQQILLDYGEIERNPELEASQALFDISKFVFGAGRPDWYTTHSVPGDPAQVLIDRSARAEMLIVGTHGHGRLIDSFMGSISRACVDHAECLVLLVPTVWTHSRHELSARDLVGAGAGTTDQ
jgi:nucleotide-binding universal stress UspA family protein